MPLIRSSKSDPVRVQLPAAGEWVEVRRSLGMDDQRYVQRRIGEASSIDYSLEGVAKGTTFNPILAAEMATFAPMERAIVNWSFADEKGKKIPINPETIRCLDQESVDAISARLKDLYEPPDEAETKNS